MLSDSFPIQSLLTTDRDRTISDPPRDIIQILLTKCDQSVAGRMPVKRAVDNFYWLVAPPEVLRVVIQIFF